MRVVFVGLLIAMLAKDLLPLGDRFILRGVSEGLALAFGVHWLLTRASAGSLQRYAVILAYLATLFITASVSQRPLFVIAQAVSLSAVVLFFIANAETSAGQDELRLANLKAVLYAFAIACTMSLVLLGTRPALAYEITTEGNRFKGLFSEPAMMGAVSGLLVGLATFLKVGILPRLVALASALPCLYLTGSRTSWGAALACLAIVALLYLRQKKAWAVGLVCLGLVSGLLAVASDFHVSSEAQSKMIRSGSIETLSGRTALWELAMEKFKESPLLGFGFTTGSDGLIPYLSSTLSTAFGVSDSSNQKAFSLHNGYIQALMDSGVLGASLYVATLGLALGRMLKYDVQRRYGAEMFGLLFFAISNLADTIIFGAAVYYEVFYWHLAVIGLGLSALTDARVNDVQIRATSLMPLDSSVRPDPVPTKHLGRAVRARRLPLLQE